MRRVSGALPACLAMLIACAVSYCGTVDAHRISPLPQRLSETGLFVPGTMQVRPDVFSFSPQYPLWSDGATKRRWIYLPAGTSIDATNPDAWVFPRGTRLWKEFSHGRAIETRFIERLTDGTWRFASYVWSADNSDAELAPSSGTMVEINFTTRYSVPAEADCRACHEGNVIPVLGFSALQLSPDRDPFAPHAETLRSDDVDLRKLIALGLLKNFPAKLASSPPRIEASSPMARAALGYLHGNCGHCHNDAGSLASIQLSLFQTQQTHNSMQSLLTSSRFRAAGIDHRITPGDADASTLVARMRSRNPYTQMPPIGTAMIDRAALKLIERWINELPSQEIQP